MMIVYEASENLDCARQFKTLKFSHDRYWMLLLLFTC